MKTCQEAGNQSQQPRQVAPRMALRVGRNVLGRANAHHHAAASAAFGPHVDQPVGGLDHVQVVLDHHDGVARVAQLVQHLEQQVNVGKMQAGGRLVQDVQRAASVALAQLQRQLDALRLAARQRGRSLAHSLYRPDTPTTTKTEADSVKIGQVYATIFHGFKNANSLKIFADTFPTSVSMLWKQLL